MSKPEAIKNRQELTELCNVFNDDQSRGDVLERILYHMRTVAYKYARRYKFNHYLNDIDDLIHDAMVCILRLFRNGDYDDKRAQFAKSGSRFDPFAYFLRRSFTLDSEQMPETFFPLPTTVWLTIHILQCRPCLIPESAGWFVPRKPSSRAMVPDVRFAGPSVAAGHRPPYQ